MQANIAGMTALITGASSGLGTDFARQLAERGCNLVLVARREDRLRQVTAEITSKYGVTVDCITMDLAETGAPKRLYDQLFGQGRAIDILINNAGIGLFGEFTQNPWDTLHQMLELDMIALTYLTHLFAPDMVKRGRGYILLISSIGAFQPSPMYAAYSAAKSYVLSFGEALHYELRKTAVRCTVLCPGVTRSEFLAVAGQRTTFYQRMTMMDSPAAVRIGIGAMLKGRSSVVAGTFNTLFALSTRLLPRQVLAWLAAWAMKEPR